MSQLTYNGQSIQQREDGYVNATQMAQANDYRLDKLMDSVRFKKYLEVLENPDTLKSGVTGVIVISQGFPAIKTTWVHPLVALMIAQDISPEFHVWCNMHIKTLMETGTTSIAEPKHQPQLPSRVVALQTAEAVESIMLKLSDSNPRLAQFLIDHAISDIMETKSKGQPLLDQPRLRGVVEIADDMGLPVNTKNRSSLGKFVKAQLGHLVASEERLVNGLMVKVACYPDTTEVRDVISSFFN